MSNTLSFWQTLPLHLDPIAFSIGFFTVHWYALFILLAFGSAYFFCRKQIVLGGSWLSKEDLDDLALLLFVCVLIGARLGYVLFYAPVYFWEHPLALVSPYGSDGQWIGIAGMSFHGGIVGAGVGLFWFSFKKKISFWRIADVVALSLPLALFAGRLGNFMNGELYGRVTEKPWGMFFFDGSSSLLRHPSALYEALLEGVVLFLLLFYFSRKFSVKGVNTALFLLFYSVIRFFIEFLREPDRGVSFLGGWMTRGQVLSLALFLIGGCILYWFKYVSYDKIKAKA